MENNINVDVMELYKPFLFNIITFLSNYITFSKKKSYGYMVSAGLDYLFANSNITPYEFGKLLGVKTSIIIPPNILEEMKTWHITHN